MMKLVHNKFRFVTILSLALVSFLITIFIVLDQNVKVHVRFNELEGEVANAKTVNQRLKFFFSGPVNKKNEQLFVAVEPAATYTTSWSNNTLFVIFKENLANATEYSVTVEGLKDVYGNDVASYTSTFTTQAAYFAYLEKSLDDGLNRIIMSDPLLESKKVLFEASMIKSYAIRNDFLAVVVSDGLTDNLLLKNLKNDEVKNFGKHNVLIDRVALSPTMEQLAYLEQSVNPQEDYVIPQSDSLIKLYDIASGETYDYNPKETAMQTVDFSYTSDGQALLYRSSDAYYFLAPWLSQEDVVQLGRYLDDGGFNRDGSKLIFVAFDFTSNELKAQQLFEYDSERKATALTDGSIPVIDPMYFYNSDKLIFAERYEELDRTPGLYKIVSLGTDGQKVQLVFEEGVSLELPRLSYDDRYVVLEQYTSSELLLFDNRRQFGFQTKPPFAELVVFDLQTQKLVTNRVHGIDAQWIN